VVRVALPVGEASKAMPRGLIFVLAGMTHPSLFTSILLPPTTFAYRAFSGTAFFAPGSGVTIWIKMHPQQYFRNVLFALDFDLSFFKGPYPNEILLLEAHFIAKCHT
jgi:hypothetical protein